MNDTELDALEAAAKAATPGPWCIPGREDLVFSEKGAQVAFCATIFSLHPDCSVIAIQAEKNAEYIAAANPATILELIAELRQAKAERDWLANKLESFGIPMLTTWLNAAKEATCQK